MDPQSFECTYERGTDDEGVGIHLLTAARTAERAIESIDIAKGEPMASGLDQRHSVCTTQEEYRSVQEATLAGEGSKDSIKAGVGLSLLLEETVTNKTVICVSIGSVWARKDSYDRSTIQLSDIAKTVLAEKGPEAFVDRFGTHFIGGYLLGANFYSHIVVTTNSAEDKQKVGASLSGGFESAVKKGGKAGSGSLSYSYEKTIRETQSSVKAQYLSSGVSQTMAISNIDKVSEAFANFSERSLENPARLVAICVPYTRLTEVTSILGDQKLVPDIKASLVNAICGEVRDVRRVVPAIRSYDQVASGRPSLRTINQGYKGRIDRELDYYRQLSLADLTEPSDSLLGRLGATVGGGASSRASEIYEAWKKDFTTEYKAII